MLIIPFCKTCKSVNRVFIRVIRFPVSNQFIYFIKVFWDTSSSDFFSFFHDMWKVFSNKAPIHLRSFDKKKVILYKYILIINLLFKDL